MYCTRGRKYKCFQEPANLKLVRWALVKQPKMRTMVNWTLPVLIQLQAIVPIGEYRPGISRSSHFPRETGFFYEIS